MKKNFYLLALLFMGTCVTLPSCSNDNGDNGGEVPTPENVKTATLDASAYNQWVYFNLKNGTSELHEIEPVAGTYSGTVKIQVAGKDQGEIENQKFEITRTTEDKDSVLLVLKSFTFGSYGDMGDISGSAKISLTEAGWELAGGEMPTSAAYKITSTEGLVDANRTLTFTVQLQLGNMPMPLSVIYEGALETGTPDESSFEWDFAMHRDNIRTNEGSALKTDQTDFTAITVLPTTGYTADTDSSVYVDTSNMMEYGPNSLASKMNTVLDGWIKRTATGTMPPYTYEVQKNIFLLKCKDGSYAKIQFTDYRDDSNNNWHNSFSYVYPVE